MRGLFPRLMVMLAVLGLSACVALAPAKGKSDADNPVTGGKIEVTSLDPPKGKDGKAQKKPAAEAPVKGENPGPNAPEGAEVALPPADAPKTKPKPRPEKADAAADTPPDPDAPDPKPAEPEVAAPEAADAAPGVAKSPSQVACEKKGNIWAKAGETGASYCAKRTRDNGKRCTKESDCEGLCLARSGTCAPFDPLFGCNEILQDNGSRVTQCIN